MKKGPPLTPEQKAQIADMREAGKSFGQIARKLKISDGAVAWHCLIAGADPPNAKPLPQTAPGPVVTFRKGFPVRRYLPDEDRRLVAMATRGVNPSEIGRALSRRPNSITGRLATLARHDARAGR